VINYASRTLENLLGSPDDPLSQARSYYYGLVDQVFPNRDTASRDDLLGLSLYDLVATYQAGQVLEIVAKDLGSGYLFVKNPDKPEEQCYLLANNVTVSGDTSALPRFTPLPSPLAPPFFKVTFKKFDTCMGQDFAIFNVENTGSVPFRSAYIKVTDQKAGESVEQALNAFDLRAHCILVKNIAPLNSGDSGFVNSLPFSSGMSEKKLRAVIMLCTEQNLKGSCITQSLDVKP